MKSSSNHQTSRYFLVGFTMISNQYSLEQFAGQIHGCSAKSAFP